MSLRDLVWLVAYETNRTVGGGLVSIELLRRRLTARGWLDAPLHGIFIAISRFTPGTVVLAYVVLLGWRFHRWRGALLALAVASVPASLIVFVLSVTLARLDQYAAVRALLAIGILVAGVLVVGSAWHLIKPYLGRPADDARLRVERSGETSPGLSASAERRDSAASSRVAPRPQGPQGHYATDPRLRLAVVAAIAVALIVIEATPVRVLLVAAVVSAALPVRRAEP